MITYENLNDVLYTLFGFILALFSGWSPQLLPHRLIDIFDTNRKAQLIVLFLLVMFTLNLFNPKTPFKIILLRSILLFFLYLIITKQSLTSFLLMIGFLVLNAILSNYIEYYKIQQDKTNDTNKKKYYNNYIINLTKTRNASSIITVIIIIVGVLLYLNKQIKDHYKSGDNIMIFILKFLFEGGRKQRSVTGSVL